MTNAATENPALPTPCDGDASAGRQRRRGCRTAGGTGGGRSRARTSAALLQEAEDEAAELKDAWLRARADIENVRKQARTDVARAHKYAIERFAGDLLPVKDALESTLAARMRRPRRCAPASSSR